MLILSVPCVLVFLSVLMTMTTITMHHDDHDHVAHNDHDVHRDHDDLGNHRKGEGDSAPSALTISKCENVDPYFH